MKALRLFLVLWLLGVTVAVAQRRLVVADLETDLPVVGANVQSGSLHWVTDSLGRFTVAADSNLTLLCSHVNYESRLVNLNDLTGDTLFVISKLLNLREVVVFGRGKTDDEQLRELRKSLRMDKTELQLMQAKPQGFNPLGLFYYLIPKKWLRKKETRKQRHQRTLDSY